MLEVLRARRSPNLFAFASPAVRLCQAALTAGVDLSGARVMLTGEPVTERRLALVRQTGATAEPHYGSIECGPLGYGCEQAVAVDEVHLPHDLCAVIQPGPVGGPPGSSADTLFFSSVRPTAPLVLLNVSLGDQAVQSERACGCPLEQLGWRTHLHSIRSHEKLTAAGMTFPDTIVIRVLEEVLPSSFGGGPTDYQLVEEQDADGRTCVRLLVHPRLGPLDEAAVAQTLLAHIGIGAGPERVMRLAWQDARLVRVERRPPLATASGKILHMHVGGGGLRPAR